MKFPKLLLLTYAIRFITLVIVSLDITMTSMKGHINAEDCYQPDKELVLTIRERLQLEQKKDRLTKAGEELSEEEGKRLTALRTATTRRLNEIIFPSMANVLYFTEMCAQHKELREFFDDAIQDLFGIRYEKKYYHKSFSPVFRRLLDALLTWSEKESPNDFRLALLELMQRTVFYKSHLFSMGQLGGDVANSIVQHDMGRAWMWTKLLAKGVEEGMGFDPDRPILFQSPKDIHEKYDKEKN